MEKKVTSAIQIAGELLEDMANTSKPVYRRTTVERDRVTTNNNE